MYERLAEYSGTPHRDCLAQKGLSWASIFLYSREQWRGTVSSNSRFQTVRFQQYSGNLSMYAALPPHLPRPSPDACARAPGGKGACPRPSPPPNFASKIEHQRWPPTFSSKMRPTTQPQVLPFFAQNIEDRRCPLPTFLRKHIFEDPPGFEPPRTVPP